MSEWVHVCVFQLCALGSVRMCVCERERERGRERELQTDVEKIAFILSNVLAPWKQL